METMKLWNSVSETDPHVAKAIAMRGGFTTVDAQSQLKRATELWGPYGGKWGLRNMKFELFRDKENSPICLMLTAEFFYPDGAFEIANDMQFSANGECCKKLQTNTTSKALSKLGFNADVYLGMFDDDRYIEELRNKYGMKSTPVADGVPGMIPGAAPVGMPGIPGRK